MRFVYSEPQVASLKEIETHWSYLDCLQGHEILDMKEQMKIDQYESTK